MDVNGTRFHLIAGAADWRSLANPDLEWDGERGSLSLRPVVQRFRSGGAGIALTPEHRRGAACDRYGNWHWIDTDRRGIRIKPCSETTSRMYWSVDELERAAVRDPASLFRACIEPPPSYGDIVLSGLTVTTRHYLVVGTLQPSGILIFDLHGAGPPEFLPWPEELDFRPFDFAPAHDGGAWILDRGQTGDGARYWRLDAYLRPTPAGSPVAVRPEWQDTFKPVGGSARSGEAVHFPGGFEPGLFSPAAVDSARAIVGLGDGSVLLLDTPEGQTHSTVVRLFGDVVAGRVELDETVLGLHLESPARVRGHDMAFLCETADMPGEVRGRLYVVGEGGDQAFAFRLSGDLTDFDLTFVPEDFPLREFGGKAIEACGRTVYYDLGERFIPITAHPRRRYVEDARLEGIVLDGKEPDCVWHRLILDACIPPGARVTVESRTANEEPELDRAEWRAEPELYLRGDGPEIAFHDPFSESEFEHAGVGSWETLFQSARGRFVELRLTLAGGGRLTPRLRALRAYYPRFSYLERYLPAVYRREPVSASFLDRYLGNVEGLFTALEDRIAKSEGLFDTRIAPEDYLDWLAGWLGATLEPEWDDARRRLFLDHAELLFRWRGTPAGMLAMIRLAIDPCADESLFADLEAGREPSSEAFAGSSVRIVERFLQRRYGGVRVGDATALGQPGTASSDAPWVPEHGAAPLHDSFRSFLTDRYAPGGTIEDALEAIAAAWDRASSPFGSAAEILLSPVLPDDAGKAADWQAFLDSELSFTYAAVDDDDAPFYREFLERRYGRIAFLNEAYQRFGTHAWASFAAVDLPAEDDFPAAGARLSDWIEFVSLAVPIRDSANRFTVLIPVFPEDSRDDYQARLDRAEAVVRREKPTHTDFDIKPFWALFRVGTARIGLDTALGLGSRYFSIQLGTTALGEGFLDHGHPWNVKDRPVIGRDEIPEIQL